MGTAPANDWGRLFSAQHHGVPAAAGLDYSPLVAAFSLTRHTRTKARSWCGGSTGRRSIAPLFRRSRCCRADSIFGRRARVAMAAVHARPEGEAVRLPRRASVARSASRPGGGIHDGRTRCGVRRISHRPRSGDAHALRHSGARTGDSRSNRSRESTSWLFPDLDGVAAAFVVTTHNYDERSDGSPADQPVFPELPGKRAGSRSATIAPPRVLKTARSSRLRHPSAVSPVPEPSRGNSARQFQAELHGREDRARRAVLAPTQTHYRELIIRRALLHSVLQTKRKSLTNRSDSTGSPSAAPSPSIQGSVLPATSLVSAAELRHPRTGRTGWTRPPRSTKRRSACSLSVVLRKKLASWVLSPRAARARRDRMRSSRRYDVFAKAQPRLPATILDSIESTSRRFCSGKRLIARTVDDPRLKFERGRAAGDVESARVTDATGDWPVARPVR